VRAARSLKDRYLKLQREIAPGVWQTVEQSQLTAAQRTIFHVSLSVNEAGRGYLGSISRTIVFRP
jgi:hypothetical protein